MPELEEHTDPTPPPAPAPPPETPAPALIDEAQLRATIERETRERMEEEFRNRPAPAPAHVADPTAPKSYDDTWAEEGMDGVIRRALEEGERRTMERLAPVLAPVAQSQAERLIDPNADAITREFLAEVEKNVGPLNPGFLSQNPFQVKLLQGALADYRRGKAPAGAVPAANPGTPVPAAAPKPEPMSPESAYGVSNDYSVISQEERDDKVLGYFIRKYGDAAYIESKKRNKGFGA